MGVASEIQSELWVSVCVSDPSSSPCTCMCNSHLLTHDSLKPMVIVSCVNFRPQWGVAQWSLWATLFEQLCKSHVTQSIWCNSMRRLLWTPSRGKWDEEQWARQTWMLSWAAQYEHAINLGPENKDNELIESKKTHYTFFSVTHVCKNNYSSRPCKERRQWQAQTGIDWLNYQYDSTLIIQTQTD